MVIPITKTTEQAQVTTTTTTTAKQAGILLTFCEQTVNISINAYIFQRIIYWLDHLSADQIMYAMEETAQAPRPSWKYTEAILRRLASEEELKRENPALWQLLQQRRREREDLPL